MGTLHHTTESVRTNFTEWPYMKYAHSNGIHWVEFQLLQQRLRYSDITSALIRPWHVTIASVVRY